MKKWLTTLDFPRPHLGDHRLKAGTLEVFAAPSVITELDYMGIRQFRGAADNGVQQVSLVRDAVGFDLPVFS